VLRQRAGEAGTGVTGTVSVGGFNFDFRRYIPGGDLRRFLFPMGEEDGDDGDTYSPGANVPPVVISEIPQTVLPQQTPRGQIPSKVDIPETWEELEDLIPEIFEPILETRPGRTPDPYPGSEAARTVIDPTPTPVSGVDDEEFTEEEPMAHTWWHLGSQVIDVLQGQSPTAQSAMGVPIGFAPSASADTFATTGGGYYTGAVQRARCKRRPRQRNMLSQSNLNILFQIATLPNNQNVRIALAKAIR